MLFVTGLIVGLVVGIPVGMLLARKSSSAPAAATAEAAAAAGGDGDSTPLLDSILGIDPEKVKHGGSEDGQATADELRQNLRVKLLHDEAKVQQAIDAEKRRDPDGNEKEWLRAAIQRWERDNR